MSGAAGLLTVLLIGHSLVSPTLPAMLDGLQPRGAVGRVDYQVINGASLQWAWNNSASAQGVDGRTVLPSGDYDVVVMTEAVPLINHVTWSDSAGYAQRWYDLAIAANPDAQVYMYETWHSLNSGTGVEVPWDDNDHIPWRQRIDQDRALWEGIVDAVNANRPTGAPEIGIVPVGEAFGRLYDAIEADDVPGISSIRDFFSDDIHPNDIGFYFVAMVHYATIHGQDPSGLTTRLHNEWGGPFAMPSPALARRLQVIAWSVVSETVHPVN